MKGRAVTVRRYACILAGTTCMACAVNLIFEPLGLVTGGIAGAAILIKKLTAGLGGQLGFMREGIPVGLTNIILNVPIFIAAWKEKGGTFLARTFLANLWFTLMLFAVPVYPISDKDYLLAAIVGGVLTGSGLGLVFMTGASTGGTDLLAVVANHHLRHISVAKILFVIDSAIVIAGAVMFGIRAAIYAVIAVYVASKVMDGIAEGLKFAKLAFVISDEYEAISDEVMQKLERGNTIIDARGMYRKEDRKMLMCVMSKKEIGIFLSIIAKHDQRAFVIVTDAKEVLGEGFIEFE